MDTRERNLLARLATWLVVGLVVVLLLRLLFPLLRFGWWLLVTIVPLILIGWLTMMLIERYRGRER